LEGPGGFVGRIEAFPYFNNDGHGSPGLGSTILKAQIYYNSITKTNEDYMTTRWGKNQISVNNFSILEVPCNPFSN
jgi:hypothetical protein